MKVTVVDSGSRLSHYAQNLPLENETTGKTLTLELVVIKVDNLEVLLGHASGGLVLIHAQDGLEHLYHLLLCLVPHGRRGVDASDLVGGLDLGGVVVGGVRVDGDCLVVLRHLQPDEMVQHNHP